MSTDHNTKASTSVQIFTFNSGWHDKNAHFIYICKKSVVKWVTLFFIPRLHFFLLFMMFDIFRTLRPRKSFFLKPAKVKALLLEKEREGGVKIPLMFVNRKKELDGEEENPRKCESSRFQPKKKREISKAMVSQHVRLSARAQAVENARARTACYFTQLTSESGLPGLRNKKAKFSH